jgi:hypothetical protein
VAGVDYNLLRSWLGLPPGPWPPDHYAILGFPPGGGEASAVEPRVMERMELLRRHQLIHPELVTEGMNRLAQALITLTDPVGKAAYDTELGVPTSAPPEVPRPPAPPQPVPKRAEAAAGRPGPLVVAEPVFDDDVFADDNIPGAGADASDMTQVIIVPGRGGMPLPYEVVEDEGPVRPLSLDQEEEPAEEVGPGEAGPEVVDAVAFEPPAWARGPVSPPVPGRRWIYTRLALLRRAQRAWERLRPVLGDPQDPLDRPGRVLILLEAVAEVRPLLPPISGVVGGVGEPGGVVAAVISQPLILDTLRRLLPDQRQALAIDWRRGQAELQKEYTRLRELIREGRARPAGARGGSVLLRWLMKTPEIMLAALAVLAIVIALFRGALVR